MRALLLTFLLVGCGATPVPQPQPAPVLDPLPAAPFAGRWGGMLEGFRQCGDGSGSNNAIPQDSWQIVADGGLTITGTECGTLTATMTPDGGQIAAGTCGGELLRGGTLTVGGDGMDAVIQVRLEITDADGCAGYDVGGLNRFAF